MVPVTKYADMIRTLSLLTVVICMLSCSRQPGGQQYNPRVVRDSVSAMAASIARDVSQKGPVAWTDYFENTPQFFMAVDGQLVFNGYDSANTFIRSVLVKSILAIQLRWSNIRINALTDQLAGIAAVYHEKITDATGKITPSDGYFTGIAHQTPQGWKLLNAHWSASTAKNSR